MTSNTTNTSVLNDLIETLKDGQEGFRVASEDVESPELKTLFNQFSLQRSSFAGELQSLARDFGQHDPEEKSSVAGALHRGWINIKAALSSHDEHAVLAECERGEDVAVAAYKKALEDPDISSTVSDTLRRQYTDVKAAHDRVKALRDATATK